MKIFLIVESGKTGRELIKHYLERGNNITELIRNMDKLKILDPNRCSR